MKRTGEILKNEREARGLSLHEIGLSLKINSKILKAIENGDSTNLPAKTFLRGFVQSYASYLKLNVDDVLKVFTDEMGSTRPQPSIKDLASEATIDNAINSVVAPPPSSVTLNTPDKPVKKEKKTSLEESSTTKGLIFSLLGVILAGLILVTMKVIDRYQREAQVTTVDLKPIDSEKTPVGETSSSEKVPTTPAQTSNVDSSTTVAAEPAPTVPVSPSSVPILKTLPAIAAVPKEVLLPKPAPTPELKPVDTKPPDVVKEVAKEVPQEKAKEPEEKKAKPIELIVEALDSVEIEYVTGAGKTEKIKLDPEQIHTFKSKAGLKLMISNGGAVNMILNGKDLGVPGDLGKSIKLNY